MKIKAFIFPTYEEWLKNSNKTTIEVGAYRCDIRAFSWTVGTCTYMFAVSLANLNPLNVYTEKLFRRTFKYDGDDEKLKQWYYDTINDFQIFWENHIKLAYLDDDKNE